MKEAIYWHIESQLQSKVLTVKFKKNANETTSKQKATQRNVKQMYRIKSDAKRSD